MKQLINNGRAEIKKPAFNEIFLEREREREAGMK
jgi:hypothetical protein